MGDQGCRRARTAVSTPGCMGSTSALAWITDADCEGTCAVWHSQLQASLLRHSTTCALHGAPSASDTHICSQLFEASTKLGATTPSFAVSTKVGVALSLGVSSASHPRSESPNTSPRTCRLATDLSVPRRPRVDHGSLAFFCARTTRASGRCGRSWTSGRWAPLRTRNPRPRTRLGTPPASRERARGPTSGTRPLRRCSR